MNLLESLSIGIGFVVSVLSPLYLRVVLTRVGAFDVPNARSSHSAVALRGLGIAPLLGFEVAMTTFLLFHTEELRTVDFASLIVLMIAAGLGGGLGLVEDIHGVPAKVRALAQFAVGAAAAIALVSVDERSWLWIPISALFFAGYTNAANFMDGVDSISSLHAVAVGLTFIAVGTVASAPWISFSGAVIAAVFLAFLPWNLAGRRLFLGDTGSYLLGSSIAAVVVGGVLGGVPWLSMIAPLSIYLADTGLTLVGRATRGELLHEAHRKHVYQRLTDSGLSHLAVGSLVAILSLISGALGLLAMTSVTGWLLSAFGVLLVSTLYLLLPRFRGIAPLVGGLPIFPHAVVPDSNLPRSFDPTRPLRWGVIGSTGFVGTGVLNSLESQSEQRVRSISAPRLTLTTTGQPEDVTTAVAANIAAVDLLATEMLGLDVVINTAGLASPDSDGGEELFGANTLLPAVILEAAQRVGVARFIHLSSAAVQGRRAVLDESAATEAFSPYSRSKALGETALLAAISRLRSEQGPELVIVRATSVQGAGRHTTLQLQRLARSALASVAHPGDFPTVVSSLRGLSEFVVAVGRSPESVPTILLQPWEGMTTASVLQVAGGRAPRLLPAGLCRFCVHAGYLIGAVVPRISGLVRRVELMWFGQAQDASWARSQGLESVSYVSDVFSARDGVLE